jgi:hypothetical protein
MEQGRSIQKSPILLKSGNGRHTLTSRHFSLFPAEPEIKIGILKKRLTAEMKEI